MQFSVIAYKLSIDEKKKNNMFYSFCTMTHVGKDADYLGLFGYGDILVSIVSTPKLNRQGILQPQNTMSLVHNNKIMSITIDEQYVGKSNFLIDNLSFKSGQYYLDARKSRKISLKKVIRENEKWKQSQTLFTKECLHGTILSRFIDTSSTENVVQQLLDKDFRKVSNKDLILYSKYKAAQNN